MQPWEYKKVHDRWGSYVVDPLLPLDHPPVRVASQYASLAARGLDTVRREGFRAAYARYAARRARRAMLSDGSRPASAHHAGLGGNDG